MGKTKENLAPNAEKKSADAKVADAWKHFDLKKAVVQDIHAAMGLLDIVLKHPQILDAVIVEIEKIRNQMIEAEKAQVKNEDFHPDLHKTA